MTEQLLLFDLPDAYDFSKSDNEGKKCNHCKQYKPLTSFSFTRSFHNSRENMCKACRSKHKKIGRELRKIYAYPLETYQCPICNRTATSDTLKRFGRDEQKTWVADHCHTTDKFRGWICFPCNIALGMFEDDPERLKKAVIYLEK